MTVQEVRQKIDEVVEMAIANVRGGAAQVPKITGRLRSAIKAERKGNQVIVWIEQGSLSEDEWEEMYSGIEDEAPWGEAPYAGTVNDYSQYWERVWLFLYQRLRVELAGLGAPINYKPKGR